MAPDALVDGTLGQEHNVPFHVDQSTTALTCILAPPPRRQ